MRPSSEREAIRTLKSLRFTIDGTKILNPPGKTSDDVSCLQADYIDFLCEEHGYTYDDSPQGCGEVKRLFVGWMDAEVQLALNGFRYALLGEKFLIVPPDNIDREKGWMRDAVDYLCAEWNYTEEEQMKESLK